MPKQNNPKAERQQRNTEKAISVVSNNKIKVTQAEEKCTCVKHPEPTHWSICPFRVLCSEGAPYTAFLSGLFRKVQNGYDQYNAGYEGYDCRKLQAFASLTDPPQYYICEIGTSDFSLKVMGRFDTINDVIATFRNIFKEHTGSTWNQRHGPIFYNPNKYCYIEYEPLSNDRKKKQPIKTWTFSEKKNSFVPVRKKTSKEQEQYISQEDLNVIYHYIGLPQAAQKKSITLKNPLFARMKLSAATLEKASQQIKTLQYIFEKRDTSTIDRGILDLFGALLPPVGCKEILMKMLHNMPKDQFLCDRLRCLLNLFKNNEEVHMVPEIQLDNILQWERPLRSKLFPLGGNSQEYKVIQTYLTNSAHCNNRKYRIEVIFGVENEHENARFKNYQTCKNRKLLWHGTSAKNVMDILTWGVKISTDTYSSQYICFTDMAARAMKNCLGYAKDCCGIFLCEVALGKRLPRGYPISSADELPWHFISEGWCFPNKDEDVQLEDGTIVPVGKSTCCVHNLTNKFDCTQSGYFVTREKFTRVRYFLICKELNDS